MKYTQVTIGLPFIPSIEKYGNIKWYVDAEFPVHNYIRSHTGGFTTIGTGGCYVHPREKMSTKISTKAELVRVDNVLTLVIWT